MNRRFTPEEDAIIRADYSDYIDVRVIAIKLNRDYGTVRQRIFYLKLKRDSSVSRILKWCPEHLTPILKEKGSVAFIESVNAHCQQAEEDELANVTAVSAKEKSEIAARIAEIQARPELERREKMMAMRALGMTLESIGGQFGLTRERARQLTDPNFVRHISQEPRKGSIKNLINVNAKLEERIADNKRRIKSKTFATLIECWGSADGETRNEFLKIVKKKASRLTP